MLLRGFSIQQEGTVDTVCRSSRKCCVNHYGLGTRLPDMTDKTSMTNSVVAADARPSVMIVCGTRPEGIKTERVNLFWTLNL